jgi:hypothetical protein
MPDVIPPRETRNAAQLAEDEYLIDVQRDIRKVMEKHGLFYRTGSYAGLWDAEMRFSSSDKTRKFAVLSLKFEFAADAFTSPPPSK